MNDLETWERKEAERLEYARECQERTFQLQERQIVAQERLATIANQPIANDGPAERWQSFFNLSSDQQDYWLREVAIKVASNVSDSGDLFDMADQIATYIRTGRP